MEAAMDSGSVRATMSIFGESISGRKAEKNRGHVLAQENLSSEMKQIAKSSMDKLNERKASVDNERAGAESELSRARAMAKELERQIDHTKAKATSQRSELQAMRGTRTRKNGAEEAPDAQYAEVAQELDRAKRELRKLKLEVKLAADAKAKAESDVVATVCKIQSNLQAADEMKRRVDEANEEHVLVELARIEAERERREIDAQRVAEAERFAKEIEAAKAKVKAAHREVIRVRELEAKLEATKADVEVLQGEMELVRAMEKNHVTDVDDGAPEATARQKKKEEAQDRALLQATEAELGAAKEELESIKAGRFQFMTSMDRTRTEVMRVVEEIDRLRAQEKNADAQVQQLNAKLLKARAQLEAVTAADERSKAIVSNLTAAMQQLHAETEAASKEEELTMLEKRCVMAEAENVTREKATAEERIKQAVKELEAAKASEASAMKKLKAAAESTMQARASRRQGTVTVSRFEYEYLSGRAALVRVVADKKVAAAQAWVQALKASEKEAGMRAEAAEREIREMGPREAQAASEAEKTTGETKALEQELYDLNATAESVGLQCAYPRRRSSRVSMTSRRSKARRSSVSAANWNPKSPSFTIKRKKKMMPSLLKLIKEKRGGSDKSNN